MLCRVSRCSAAVLERSSACRYAREYLGGDFGEGVWGGSAPLWTPPGIPSSPPHPPLAGGAAAVGVDGAEIFGELAILQLQGAPGHQGGAETLRGGVRTGWGGVPNLEEGSGVPNPPSQTLPDPSPYRSAGGEHAVEHVAAQRHAHHQVCGITGEGGIWG